jgi:hypothetical protein
MRSLAVGLAERSLAVVDEFLPLEGSDPGSAPRVAAVRPAAVFGDRGMVGYQVVRVRLRDDGWDATGQVIRVADRDEA